MASAMRSNKVQVQGQSRAASLRSRSRSVIVCQAGSESTARRSILLAGAATALSPLIIVRDSSAAVKYLEVDNLSSFQRSDQRTEFVQRAQKTLREVLTAEDAPACVRLALHDAGTYDLATKAGGFDGSIALNSEELGRPENSTLSAIVDKLSKARDQINAGDKVGAGEISWADTIYLAGKVSTQLAWIKAKTGSSGGKVIANQFGNPWPVEIGRVDRTEAGPTAIPALDAPVAEIRQYLLKLGAKPGAGANILTPRAPFWERPGYLIWTAAALDPAAEEARFAAEQPETYADISRSYTSSKTTVTRTDYEVDFAAVYNKLCSLGAKFDNKKYLYRIPIQALV